MFDDPQKLAEITARDKRGAAYHEAAHLAVAAVLGIRGRAWLTPTDQCDAHTLSEPPQSSWSPS